MKNWWIGCSGFSYDRWRNDFYPPKLAKRRWFEFYCEHFNTVELNVTFYRFPRPETLRQWYDRSPEDFRFTVKVPRLITHYKRFINVTKESADFYNAVAEGLSDKLGTILFQLHPGIIFSDENLERIIEAIDPGFSNTIEFRHESWWNEKVFTTLKKNGISFCSISYPGLPGNVVKTNDTVYYRFHGVPQLYKSPYSDEQLQGIWSQINPLKGVKDVYAYFNNDIDVAAVFNAKKLQDIVSPVEKNN